MRVPSRTGQRRGRPAAGHPRNTHELRLAPLTDAPPAVRVVCAHGPDLRLRGGVRLENSRAPRSIAARYSRHQGRASAPPTPPQVLSEWRSTDSSCRHRGLTRRLQSNPPVQALDERAVAEVVGATHGYAELPLLSKAISKMNDPVGASLLGGGTSVPVSTRRKVRGPTPLRSSYVA